MGAVPTFACWPPTTKPPPMPPPLLIPVLVQLDLRLVRMERNATRKWPGAYSCVQRAYSCVQPAHPCMQSANITGGIAATSYYYSFFSGRKPLWALRRFSLQLYFVNIGFDFIGKYFYFVIYFHFSNLKVSCGRASNGHSRHLTWRTLLGWRQAAHRHVHDECCWRSGGSPDRYATARVNFLSNLETWKKSLGTLLLLYLCDILKKANDCCSVLCLLEQTVQKFLFYG